MSRTRWRFNPWAVLAAISFITILVWNSPSHQSQIPVSHLRGCAGPGADWHGAQIATQLDSKMDSGSRYYLVQAGDVLAVTRLNLSDTGCNMPYQALAGDYRPLSAAIPFPVAEAFERTLVERAISRAGGREAYQQQLLAATEGFHPLPVTPETLSAFVKLGIQLPSHYTVIFEDLLHA